MENKTNPFTQRIETDESSEVQKEQDQSSVKTEEKKEEKKPEDQKPKKKLSLWLVLTGLFITLILLVVFMVFVLAVGGYNNPVLKTFGIDPYFLKESLINLTSVSFGFIVFILFILLVFGIFRGLMAKKDDRIKKKGSFILSMFSFGMMFLTIMVWLGVFNFISRFVVNAEPPSAEIRFSPSQEEILQMEGGPIEVTLSALQAKSVWERKRRAVEGFAWDLNNDGEFEFRTNELEFTQEFNQSGPITLQLMVFLDGGDQDIIKRELKLPSVSFDYTPKKGPAPLVVSFDAAKFTSPRYPIIEYAWDFDEDGEWDTIIDRAKTEYTFKKIGVYEVLLRTKTQTGVVERYSAQVQVLGGVNAIEAFEAKISISPSQEGVAPLKLRFSGEESVSPNGDIISYEWDFGDMTIKEKGETVDHIFQEPGEYQVKLVLKDETGETQSAEESISVHAKTSAPVAIIQTEPQELTGQAPFSVDFDASSSEDVDDNIVAYEWDYNGDGTADVQSQRFTHVFRENGEYTVRLTVRDSDGQESEDTVVITVSGEVLQAKIITNPNSGAVPLTVDFDASSSLYPTGKIVSYEWDFGDGTSPQLSGAQKSHRYTRVGVYDVVLTVYTDDGKSAQATTKIYARTSPTQACFTASRHEGIAPLPVTFDSLCSVGNIQTWKWDFGDGFISRDRNPVHNFQAAGVYTVTLEIIDDSNNVSEYSDVIEVK